MYVIPPVDTLKKYCEVLGTGCYGRVYLDRQNRVAIKTPKGKNDIRLSEVKILKLAGDLGISPKILSHDRRDKGLIIAMEFIDGEVARNRLKQGYLDYKLSKKILERLAFMHTNEIAHEDLHLDNVLIDRWGKIFFIDFGYSSLGAKYVCKDIYLNISGSSLYFSLNKEIMEIFSSVCDEFNDSLLSEEGRDTTTIKSFYKELFKRI